MTKASGKNPYRWWWQTVFGLGGYGRMIKSLSREGAAVVARFAGVGGMGIEGPSTRAAADGLFKARSRR